MALWAYESGTVEHVVEVARVLGYVTAGFVRSYETFMDSPVTAKNELTVSALIKTKEVSDAFVEALVAYDAARASECASKDPQ